MTPSSTATASSTDTRSTSGAASRAASRARSSVRASPSPSIQTIILYAETATPLPDPLPAEVMGGTGRSDQNAEEEQAADPVEEPARETASGGFPVRRTIGILAALVAAGSAWSLITSGRRKPGRRSIGRTPRRL